MKKKLLLGIGGLVVVLAVLVSGGYALSVERSDVGKPQPTPAKNMVKYHVVGTSMDPTIADGDWLLAQTDVKTIKRGDLVIMRDPRDETKIYCRRVVGVAGDKVVMKYYSNVKITTVSSDVNPQVMVFPSKVAPEGNAYGEYDASVGVGTFYVAGDNYVPGGSYDSDEWGLLPQKNVIGVVTSRTSPNSRSF